MLQKKKKENPDNEMEFLTSDWILSWRQENDPTVLGNAAHPQKKIMRGNTGQGSGEEIMQKG